MERVWKGGGREVEERGMKMKKTQRKMTCMYCRGGKRQMADRKAKRPAKMKKRQAALMKEEWRVGTFTDLRRYEPLQLIGLNKHRCLHFAVGPCLPPYFLCLLRRSRS